MLFSVSNLSSIWNVKSKGVLHVGAHEGEEWTDYRDNNWLPVIWIEGQSELVRKLQTQLPPESNTIIQAFVWDQNDVEMTFNIANNGQSSSLLEFGTHSHNYPQIKFDEKINIKTTRLDSIISATSEYDFINIDLQGVELKALVGLGNQITKAKWIYSEVNRKEVYQNCTSVRDLDKFLKTCGYSRKATRWCVGKGWGDALYIHNSIETKYFNLKSWIPQTKWYFVEILKYAKLRISRLIHATVA
jgi:FkbM family methyltransferase